MKEKTVNVCFAVLFSLMFVTVYGSLLLHY